MGLIGKVLGRTAKTVLYPPSVVIDARRALKLRAKNKAIEELEAKAGHKLAEHEIEKQLPEHLQDLNEKGKKIKPLTSDSNKKILNAIGKQATKEWNEAEKLSAGIEVIANKMAPAMFKKVNYHETGDAVTDFVNKMNHPTGYVMRMGPTLAIPAIALAYGLADKGVSVQNRNKMGRIQAGDMANMVNKTRSPGIYSDSKLSKLGEPHHDPLSTHGAEGDLVFALHNLR